LSKEGEKIDAEENRREELPEVHTVAPTQAREQDTEVDHDRIEVRVVSSFLTLHQGHHALFGSSLYKYLGRSRENDLLQSSIRFSTKL
jgi:hypothetical protein